MRLVDADKLRYKHSLNTINTTMPQSFPCITKEEINKAPTVEAIPVTEKAFEMFETDYKNRLKADLEAILTDLKLEIEETEVDVDYAQLYYCKIIQEKINALKEDADDN